jgi:hypothetical protein
MKPQALLACSSLLLCCSTTTRSLVDGFAITVVGTTATTAATTSSRATSSFSRTTNSKAKTTTALHMGLFDGVKDAFSAPALERSAIDSERETPIDRWMGWSVAATDASKLQQQQQQQQLDNASTSGTYNLYIFIRFDLIQ